jgi:uncharacterized protein (TIGR02996 family)
MTPQPTTATTSSPAAALAASSTMPQRVLTKNGKALTLTATDRTTADALVDQSKSKLKQGWTPTGRPADAVTLARALLDLGVDLNELISAFAPDEVDAIYRQFILDDREDLTEWTLRAKPTRALLEHLLTKEHKLLGSDLSKAVKFISKDETVAAWVQAVMERALTASSPRLTKFAGQQLKNASKRAIVPEAPKVAAGSETELLRLIAEKPTDDAPRLVYADFLTERGIGWGEVIPVLLKPAPEYGTPEYAPHSALVEKLLKKHLKTWLEPIRPFLTGWSTEGGRGLLSSVDTQPAKFIEAAEAIALRAPRALLMLGGLKAKDLPALVATPLGRFAEVRLSEQRLDDAQVALLAGSSTIAGVERWDLSGNHFGDEGLRALANSPNFRACQQLLLGGLAAPAFTAAGLTTFFASRHWPALELLDLGVTGPGEALAQAKGSLRSLTLKTLEPVGDDVVLALTRSLAAASLEQLTVQWHERTTQRVAYPFTEAGLLHLVQRLPKLTHLSVPAGALPASVTALLKAR